MLSPRRPHDLHRSRELHRLRRLCPCVSSRSDQAGLSIAARQARVDRDQPPQGGGDAGPDRTPSTAAGRRRAQASAAAVNDALRRPPARFRVAIVGAGPSGFYAAEALLRAGPSIDVDMFERLPVPHGLVRFGVAPDHPKLKQVTLVFNRIANTPGFRFFGGIEIGGAVSLDALRASYHAVVLATGAAIARLMDIPGETLPGSYRAADFVAWYNGHPDFRDCHFDLSGERAIIVGHGNVALDVARILAKTADELRHTDIAAHALDALARSRIRDIHVVGRRGPGDTKFAAKELMEFEELGECDPMIGDDDAADVLAAAACADGETAATLAILKRFAARSAPGRRRCIFRFNLAPATIGGDGRAERMLF